MSISFIPPAYAACNVSSQGLDLGECLTLSNGATVKSTYTTPAQVVNLIVSNLFVIAGLVLFILIIYAGFRFIAGDVKGKEEAQNIITSALIGFIVMFSAYWIVQIIQQITGANILF